MPGDVAQDRAIHKSLKFELFIRISYSGKLVAEVITIFNERHKVRISPFTCRKIAGNGRRNNKYAAARARPVVNARIDYLSRTAHAADFCTYRRINGHFYRPEVTGARTTNRAESERVYGILNREVVEIRDVGGWGYDVALQLPLRTKGPTLRFQNRRLQVDVYPG